MFDIMGFGRPLDDIPMILQPGVLTMAWGSVVRQMAAGLDVELDARRGVVRAAARPPRPSRSTPGPSRRAPRPRCASRCGACGTAGRSSCSSTSPGCADDLGPGLAPAGRPGLLPGGDHRRAQLHRRPPAAGQRRRPQHRRPQGHGHAPGQRRARRGRRRRPGLLTALDLPLVTGRGLVAEPTVPVRPAPADRATAAARAAEQ